MPKTDLNEDSYVLCPTCMGTFSNCLRCNDLGLILAVELSREEVKYVEKYKDSMLYWSGGGKIHIDIETEYRDNPPSE